MGSLKERGQWNGVRNEQGDSRQAECSICPLNTYTLRPLYTQVRPILTCSFLYFQNPLTHIFTPSSLHLICHSLRPSFCTSFRPCTIDTLSFPPPFPLLSDWEALVCRPCDVTRRSQTPLSYLIFLCSLTFLGNDSDGHVLQVKIVEVLDGLVLHCVLLCTSVYFILPHLINPCFPLLNILLLY